MLKMPVCIVVAMAITMAFFSDSTASYARVESMGKHATFFMDDVSIFDNAANMNVFPNFIIGELGRYLPGQSDIDAMEKASQLKPNNDDLNPRYNRDPENPWFGGIFSYSLSPKEEGSLYPQLSIGGAFNRRNELLLSLLPDSVDLGNRTFVVPDPVTNFDGFLGFTLRNGGMVGTHIYLAVQEGANWVNGNIEGELDHAISNYLFQWDMGFNWPIARNVDGELAFGFTSVKFGDEIIDPELSFFVKARCFSTLEVINGELVPIINFNQMNAPGVSQQLFNFGIGINASLDRGFFWLGFEGVFKSSENRGFTELPNGKVIYDREDDTQSKEVIRGGRISFGIERNIWWDWLVIRVGAQKLMASHQKNNSYFMSTNAISNGKPDDHVGFGIGLNIEEKLKVDATIAEDFVYSFGNLLSGPHHHVISRVSATYSF